MAPDGMIDLTLWTELRFAALRSAGAAWSNRQLEEILAFKAFKHGLRVLMDREELDPGKSATHLLDWNGTLVHRAQGRDEAFEWIERNGERLDGLRRAQAESMALAAVGSEALRPGAAALRV